MSKFVFRAVAASVLAFSAVAGAHAQEVTGAGASFPAPLYSKWAAEYNAATKVRINYQSVGSGAGMRQIEAGTVDFGASDIPLQDKELKEKGLVQFPTVVGGVVPVVNIPGIKPGELRLSGPVLADIYLGKITSWNDEAITKLNPGVKLPNQLIAVVRRADGSGTTFTFTNYLSQVSPEWKKEVGEGSAVKWPTGAGGKGNEGVAAFVTRLPDSIGYVEFAYAKQNNIAYVQMENHDGDFVRPSIKGFQAAAAGADWENSFYQILNNKPGADAWPITAATYIVMHEQQKNPQKAKEVLQFFNWAYTNGDKDANELDYVPLPTVVKNDARQLWSKSIRDTSGKAIDWK